MHDLVDEQQRRAAFRLRELLSAYHEHEDLISIGAYRKGSNANVDVAVAMLDDINGFLRQGIHEVCTMAESRASMIKLLERSLVPLPKAPVAMGGVAAG